VVLDTTETTFVKHWSCEGFDALEKMVLSILEDYPIEKVGIEVARYGNGCVSSGIHETIGALKYMLRGYGKLVSEVSGVKVANYMGPHSTKKERMAWVFENYGVACCEHVADAAIVALICSENKEGSLGELRVANRLAKHKPLI
jgi:hypothetical protein